MISPGLIGTSVSWMERVNGAGPLRFLLDSGAQLDLIQEAHRVALGIKRVGAMRLNATSGHSLCEGAAFELDGASYRPGRIGATILTNLESVIGCKIDGILGAGFSPRSLWNWTIRASV